MARVGGRVAGVAPAAEEGEPGCGDGGGDGGECAVCEAGRGGGVSVVVSGQDGIPERAGGGGVVDDEGGDGAGVGAGDGVVGVAAQRAVDERAGAGAGAGGGAVFGQGGVGEGLAALEIYLLVRRGSCGVLRTGEGQDVHRVGSTTPPSASRS